MLGIQIIANTESVNRLTRVPYPIPIFIGRTVQIICNYILLQARLTIAVYFHCDQIMMKHIDIWESDFIHTRKRNKKHLPEA